MGRNSARAPLFCWIVVVSSSLSPIMLPAAIAAGDAGHGQAIFLQYCQGCHGPDGRGGGKGFMPHVGPLARRGYIDILPDEYLADVIQESKSRFNIDPDRVFLVGHSMGGFGAYHHIQRQPDRFAGVVVNAGSWELGHWPTIRGTRLCIVQGVHDAQCDSRWHYTDIEYARWTKKLLSRQKHDFVYNEHDGEHSMHSGRKYLASFFETTRALRRNPYHPHVVLASPVGFTRWYCFPVQHNRWLTLDEADDG